MTYMKIFKVQPNLTSYAYPLSKTAICLIIILLGIFRNQIIHSDSLWVNAIITTLGFTPFLLSILCLYISVGELFCVYSNKKHKKMNLEHQEYELVSAARIIALLQENDILEIVLLYKNEIIKIGTSSNCKNSDSHFFDKRYYVDSFEYETLAPVQEIIYERFPEDNIPVLEIDGRKPGDGLREP